MLFLVTDKWWMKFSFLIRCPNNAQRWKYAISTGYFHLIRICPIFLQISQKWWQSKAKNLVFPPAMLGQIWQNIKYENFTSSCSCFISSAIILQSRHSCSVSTVIFLHQSIRVLYLALCIFLYQVYCVLHQVFFVFINQVLRVFYIKKGEDIFWSEFGKRGRTTHILCRGRWW